MKLERNLGIYEALWQEAVELDIFPLKDPFDGVEDDIHLAKMLNRLNPARTEDDAFDLAFEFGKQTLEVKTAGMDGVESVVSRMLEITTHKK
ncbi:MAG TPA: hypothetical protein VK186_10330 [Candidatus Deferrimicrobium sp.]|nr:hypothetical protein [Candidatus Deferrimicrobium sp.]